MLCIICTEKWVLFDIKTLCFSTLNNQKKENGISYFGSGTLVGHNHMYLFYGLECGYRFKWDDQ